ncbi:MULTISPECIES: Hsp20/alpha crystallin family protein [Desulfosediminicola]|uniref:Hsp20/alpha crystallin family protein n=1 Tax=Desulfosediminicola TaxID=2886823 RepID=UPI0010AB7B6E|nr:Hsp20/alpha crystallin family protein [Desulfosediminicola ganghwensis]
MNIVRYNHGRNRVVRPNTDIDRFFDGFFGDFFGPTFNITGNTARQHNQLHVDVYEQEGVIHVEAEMAGVPKEDIKLDVKGKHLTLGYERKVNENVTEENRYRRERSYGKFERSFSLPFDIDADKVVAKYENGILKLEIPKPEEQQPKQITIN